MLGLPIIVGNDYDIWRLQRLDYDYELPDLYVAVEYENDIYSRIGFPAGTTPSDNDPTNASYCLKNNYKSILLNIWECSPKMAPP